MTTTTTTTDNRYRIIRCELGGWNVVDCIDVERPENGRIVGATHSTRERAREAVADLND